MIEELLTKTDWNGIVTEYIFHSGFDSLFKAFSSKFQIIVKDSKIKKNKEKYKVNEDTDQAVYNIVQVIKSQYKWSEEISFKDLQEKRYLTDVFIHINFYLTPERQKLDGEELDRLSLTEVINSLDDNLIILGGPGAGKTTLLKYLCSKYLNPDETNFKCPIVIKLRNYNERKKELSKYNSFLLWLIIESLGLTLEIPKFENDFQENYFIRQLKLITYGLLEDLNILLLIDGFDELQNSHLRNRLIEELKELSLSIQNTKYILTSRTGDFHYHLENTSTYQICPLSQPQINDFVSKWIQNKEKSEKLLEQIFNSPYADTAVRPLTLAHLCAIFERYKRIPDKPIELYNRIIRLLLEEWDLQRNITRDSIYSDFTVDRKLLFLSHISYLLTTSFKSSIFNRNQLEEIYSEICYAYDLPPHQIREVIDEVESHNGLFLQAGYSQYEFAHKSLQEYLAAQYISGLPSIPKKKKVLLSLPNELAISVALSSTPGIYLGTLFINKLGRHSSDPEFLVTFFTRLKDENPSFNDNPVFAAGIIYAYNSILKEIEYKYQEKKEIYSKAIILIEDLMNSSKGMNSFANLSQYYKTNGTQVMKNQTVNEYVRKKSIIDRFGVEVPKKIYLNKMMSKTFIKF